MRVYWLTLSLRMHSPKVAILQYYSITITKAFPTVCYSSAQNVRILPWGNGEIPGEHTVRR